MTDASVHEVETLRATSSAIGSSTAAVSGPIVAFKTGATPFHLIHEAVGVLPDKLFGWIEYGEFSETVKVSREQCGASSAS
jgi:hypothetical protein